MRFQLGTPWSHLTVFFTTFAVPVHLSTYSLHSLRRSDKSQGWWGLSIRPAEHSSQRYWRVGEPRTRPVKYRLTWPRKMESTYHHRTSEPTNPFHLDYILARQV